MSPFWLIKSDTTFLKLAFKLFKSLHEDLSVVILFVTGLLGIKDVLFLEIAKNDCLYFHCVPFTSIINGPNCLAVPL